LSLARFPEAPNDSSEELRRTWTELIRILEAQQDYLIKSQTTEALAGTLKNYTIVTTDYALTSQNVIVEANISSNITLTLPTPSTNKGQVFNIINNYNSTANVILSETLDGVSSPTLTPSESVPIVSNGIEYLIEG